MIKNKKFKFLSGLVLSIILALGSFLLAINYEVICDGCGPGIALEQTPAYHFFLYLTYLIIPLYLITYLVIKKLGIIN